MTWDVNKLYQLLLKLIRKNQAAAVSSTDFFYFWNAEQSTYQQDLLGRFQPRSNSKLGMNTGMIENETIETKLAPFMKGVGLPVTGGFADKPDDFVYEAALRIDGYEVKKINHNQVASVLNNLIDPPSIPLNIYYAIEYDTRYSFLPGTISGVVLDYYSHPTDVLWAYTLDGANRQVYDAANSVQPQWLSNDVIEITKRVLKTLGVSFHDNDFIQMGNSVIQTGN